MFNPKTEKIEKLLKFYPDAVRQIEKLFDGTVNMYIDYANVRPWSNKLKWHIDIRRLKQFFDSFNNVNKIKFYSGTLAGNDDSVKFINELEKLKYEVKTKSVKIIRLSVDATSTQIDSPALLNQFVRRALMRKYNIDTIEFLNEKFAEMNKAGIYFIEDRKCNFDVEIGVDMLIDYERNNIDTYVLWSGDSDFYNPIKQLLDNNKNVALFATSRRVSTELNNLKPKGLFIFDIQKIRNFICWKKEIQSKEDPN